ncbi:MAG TPA: glycosyltransferase [Gemmataceae bacterium]|jgi:glycosyltransferase involved in cell wall biosynthesis
MIVAYLAPYYPHGSHSFIRREIAALERLGLTVERFSTRPAHGLVDPADVAEAGRTTALVAAGPAKLIAATTTAAVRHPVRFVRALRTAVRLGRRSERGVVKHLIYIAEACLLLRLMRDRGVSHLHAHFGTNATTIALLARTLGGPPYSFTVHGPDEFDRPQADSLGEKVAGSAFAVAVSSYGRSQLYRWADPQDWGKIRVVHCGLDASFLGADSVPVPAAPRLVCVGRLAEQKGQLLLLQALAQLAAEGVAFEAVLAGDGPLRPTLEAEIGRLQLTGRVRITGWLSGADVRREIDAARGLVLPSFAEGLPVVLMEALALGRPVVSTFVAGIPELVRDGVHGWLVPAGNVEELAAAVRELLCAPVERLAAMGKAGAARVAERHAIDREAEKLAELFSGRLRLCEQRPA